jgi:hypothetical protein
MRAAGRPDLRRCVRNRFAAVARVSVASAVSHYALLSLLVMTLVLVAYHLLRNRLGRPGSDAAPPVSPLPAPRWARS